jgi:hypothetical protein
MGGERVSAGVSRFTYHAPLDPDCPAVRAFRESPRGRAAGPDLIEDFQRRHRAECERCHVYGAVHMEARDA